jgi:hypothetical protein
LRDIAHLALLSFVSPRKLHHPILSPSAAVPGSFPPTSSIKLVIEDLSSKHPKRTPAPTHGSAPYGWHAGPLVTSRGWPATERSVTGVPCSSHLPRMLAPRRSHKCRDGPQANRLQGSLNPSADEVTVRGVIVVSGPIVEGETLRRVVVFGDQGRSSCPGHHSTHWNHRSWFRLSVESSKDSGRWHDETA